MKAILCFALLLAVCSAFTFFPSWKPINPDKSALWIDSVAATSNAKVGQSNVLTVCGKALLDIQGIRSFSYEVGQGSDVWSNGNVDLTSTDVPMGKSYCFLYNYVVPRQVVNAYSVNLTLETPLSIITGVQVNFKI